MRRLQLFVGILLLAALGAVGCDSTLTGLPQKEIEDPDPPPEVEGLRAVSTPSAYWLA
ncbi:MAG: hypothetical protein JSW46_04010 [Gemmatimonadota bacterium]|nr:MAG: hypothetical protein JSW46_04010 [Gemmatimonadota bacterium]